MAAQETQLLPEAPQAGDLSPPGLAAGQQQRPLQVWARQFRERPVVPGKYTSPPPSFDGQDWSRQGRSCIEVPHKSCGPGTLPVKKITEEGVSQSPDDSRSACAVTRRCGRRADNTPRAA